jgi:colanic acid biosynthesis glycosyl transferase WcaI
MLSSGRPVVATAHPETELGRVVATCGVVVEPEQPEALAAAIAKLAADATLRADLGTRARAYAEKHIAQDAVLRQFEGDVLACLEPA